MLLLFLQRLGIWFERHKRTRQKTYLESMSDVSERGRRLHSLETRRYLDYYKLSYHYEPGRNDASYGRGFWRSLRHGSTRPRDMGGGPTRE